MLSVVAVSTTLEPITGIASETLPRSRRADSHQRCQGHERADGVLEGRSPAMPGTRCTD